MSISRGHGTDLHCLSPAASPALSLDFLYLSLSVPQIHQPLLCSRPLDPSFHCLEPPLCLLLTDSYSLIRSQVKHCFSQQDTSASLRWDPIPCPPLLILLRYLLSHLLPPSAWKSSSCVSSRDPSTCLWAWAQEGSVHGGWLWKHPGCRWTTFQVPNVTTCFSFPLGLRT